MVPHHRVHQDKGLLPTELGEEAVEDADLLFGAQKAAVDGVEAHMELPPVQEHPFHLVGEIQKGG